MKIIFYIKNFLKKRKWKIYEKECDVLFFNHKLKGIVRLEYSTNKLPFKYKSYITSPVKNYNKIDIEKLKMDEDFNNIITRLERKEKLEKLKNENKY